MPQKNVVSVSHVIHLSLRIITDMNQSVLADIRLSLGLVKVVVKI